MCVLLMNKFTCFFTEYEAVHLVFPKDIIKRSRVASQHFLSNTLILRDFCIGHWFVIVINQFVNKVS